MICIWQLILTSCGLNKWNHWNVLVCPDIRLPSLVPANVPLAPPTPWDVAITWSGLVWQRNGPPLAAAARRVLTTAFLTSADQWLSADTAWRWTTISESTDPVVDHTTAIGPVPILCTTHWLYFPEPTPLAN